MRPCHVMVLVSTHGRAAVGLVALIAASAVDVGTSLNCRVVQRLRHRSSAVQSHRRALSASDLRLAVACLALAVGRVWSIVVAVLDLCHHKTVYGDAVLDWYLHMTLLADGHSG